MASNNSIEYAWLQYYHPSAFGMDKPTPGPPFTNMV